ncbi:MAG: hypothetical protein WA611_09225, partial [Candidatus Acidiferrales bacterium]
GGWCPGVLSVFWPDPQSLSASFHADTSIQLAVLLPNFPSTIKVQSHQSARGKSAKLYLAKGFCEDVQMTSGTSRKESLWIICM